MSKITIFTKEDFGEIRTVEENGKVLFCGSDIARALGYSNPYDAINRHCKVEGVVKHEGVSITTNQYGVSTEQTTEMKFITEGNVYRLITHSKLPTAQKFESWVFDEILPTIRKTGGFVANDDTFIETYLPFADDNTKALFRVTLDTVRKQNEVISKQNKQIEEERPLVEFADHVSNTSNLLDIGELSKLAHKEHIDIGRTRLFTWLRHNGYLMSSPAHKNEPYQKYITQGLFQVREYTYNTPYGVQTGIKTYITGKGQIYFVEKLRKLFGNKTGVSGEPFVKGKA